MHYLRFDNADTMAAVLGTSPQSVYGLIIVRGRMGIPAITEPDGVDAHGEPQWREITPAVDYGYMAELHTETVPEALAPYVFEMPSPDTP